MPTIDLLSGLQVYIVLLGMIAEKELDINADARLVKTVSLAYNTISLKLHVSDSVKTLHLYLQATFQINQQQVTLKEIYCEKKDSENRIRNLILTQAPDKGYRWDTSTKLNLYEKQVMQYVAIADEIAKEGHLCSAGDDYVPGYFSEISITDYAILLKQINHHNSRSIDHKDDYYMRDLEFHIPLKPHEEKELNKTRLAYDDHQIGDMLICFSDRSSDKNKRCGNAISDKIREETDRFKQKNN